MGYFQYCHYGDCYYRLWLTKNVRRLVGMDRTVCGDGRGLIRISAGTRVDGCEVCGHGWGRD